ncbi:MAG: MFS transporter [Desulfobacterium sp.]
MKTIVADPREIILIDPKDYLDKEKMSRLQKIVVMICMFLMAMDGFDVLSISFAAPGIAREWGITKAALGIVLSMELIGMSIGSFFLGGAADSIGRRPTLIGCLVVMSGGMLLVSTAANPFQLCVWRIIVGLGIGGMLSCTNAITAEFSNSRHRSLCISMIAVGYPLGGLFGGFFASRLLGIYDWRSIFYLGAIVTVLLLPVVYFLVPESVHWLARKQPLCAMDRINKAMKRMGHPSISALPKICETERKKSIGDIFSPSLIRPTLLLTLAYFLHITTFYFILKWSPKIVVDLGFSASMAGTVLVWANLGGVLGGGLFGFLATYIDLKKITVSVLILACIFVSVFGHTPPELNYLRLLAALGLFFGNAGVVALFSILATAFPTHARAAGIGFVIGMGRLGAVLSPILVGVMFQAGASLPTVAMVMGSGALLAALVLLSSGLKLFNE